MGREQRDLAELERLKQILNQLDSRTRVEAESILGRLIGLLQTEREGAARQRDVLAQHESLIDMLGRKDTEHRQLFDAIPAMIWLKDLDNRIMRCNLSAAKTAGKTVQEMEWHHTAEFYPDEAGKYWSDDLEVIQSGRPKLGIVELHQVGSGEKIWIRTDKIPYRDETGTIVGVLVFALDISAEKRAEDERDSLLARERILRAEAEAGNRLKEEFLATLSHELRTPLTAVLGYAGLLQDDKLDPAARTRALASIERNARAQVRLIEDLLDASRAMSGQLRIEPSMVDPVRAIESAVDTIRPAADAKRIALSLTTELRDCVLWADPIRVQQIIWNLLSNAIKFTPGGGRVNVRIRREGGEIVIVVQDTGEGIDPGFLPFVFERFRQGDSTATRRHSGLGLGLAIVRDLVELHGGTVRAESGGPGTGTTFTVRLPIRPVEGLAPAQPAGPVPSAPVHRRDELRGLRVLVVDDDADALEFIRISLEQLGAVVRAVASAREALAIAPQFAPQVLVSDLAMPGLDGIELLRELRAQRSEVDEPLRAIALTAYGEGDDLRRLRAAGFEVRLRKPIESLRLAMAVSRLWVPPEGDDPH
jgi:PAS domain S-box-containing protein